MKRKTEKIYISISTNTNKLVTQAISWALIYRNRFDSSVSKYSYKPNDKNRKNMEGGGG